MRATLILLLSVLFSSSVQAVTWSKSSYGVHGSKVLRADFTGDGFPDLLVYGGSDLTILRNLGNGTFDIASSFSVPVPLTDAVLLDFDRDGRTDIAGCRNDNGALSLVILESNNGTDLSPTSTPPIACSWVAAGDFNHDGNPDVAVGVAGTASTGGDNQVVVVFGNGHGGIAGEVVNDNVNFTSQDGDSCALDGEAVAADFDGDGVTDIAFTATCTPDIFNASVLIVGKSDGTGRFTFHKDQDLQSDAGIQLRLGDLNQDGRRDIFGRFEQDFPFANGDTFIRAFISDGDGTFTPKQLLGTNISESFGDTITAYEITDADGDGIKDIVAVISTFTDNSGPDPTFSFRVYKGHSDGSYTLIQNSALASTVIDMVWGDFNKDGRADIALVRNVGNATDVWLNTTSTTASCPAATTDRTFDFCALNLEGGNYHFVGSPLDRRPINATQLYVDGALKFTTTDDLLDTNLNLSSGRHRVTAKAWDDLGAFSSVINLTVISARTNSTNRTVHICSPLNATVISGTGGQVEVTAAAATNLAFSSIQVYLDGTLAYRSTTKSIDTKLTLTTGTHHMTVKGWDSSGAFSSSVNVTVK